jgi:hypothetical protein
MQLPPPAPETLLDDLWPDLPPETTALAGECNALGRASQVKTPPPRWRVVWCSGGGDKSRRETAAACTRLSASSPDAALAERGAACRPWRQAVWSPRRHTQPVATRPAAGRCLGIDGSHVHGPGARGPQSRLHRWMALGP